MENLAHRFPDAKEVNLTSQARESHWESKEMVVAFLKIISSVDFVQSEFMLRLQCGRDHFQIMSAQITTKISQLQ
jgi:hypothetical protein